ncbi:hypothetical protein B0H14DRAFT_1561586 [Mycena olivaceomarginata]|nr:hypothetical protein B0H14DRAFT_1561586 [Mycena olivaceomarginata]
MRCRLSSCRLLVSAAPTGSMSWQNYPLDTNIRFSQCHHSSLPPTLVCHATPRLHVHLTHCSSRGITRAHVTGQMSPNHAHEADETPHPCHAEWGRNWCAGQHPYSCGA